MSSDRPDTDMASPAMADGDDDGADGEGEEEDHGGAGHIEGDNRNGADRGDGGGVSGVCRGLNVSAGGASWQQGSGQSQGPQSGGPPLPSGWKSSEKEVVVVRLPPGTSDASRRLSMAIIRRTITDAQQVTQLIEQNGADPNVEPRLRVAGSTGRYSAYPLLSLAIDGMTTNSVPSIWAGNGDVDDGTPVVLPMWETPGLKLAVMKALIESGADINTRRRPIRVAIASCNREAFGLLMGQPGAPPFTPLATRIQLRGLRVMELPVTLPTDQPTEESEATLLSFYQLLIQRDSTLAAERSPNGGNPMHWAAMTPPVWSQQFIENYIDLLVANGADIRAVDNDGVTPLHYAAFHGSHCVATSLCRRLTAADTQTPLAVATIQLDEVTQQLQDDTTGQAVRDQASIRIPNLKTTIRVLLQAGADIAIIPTATEEDRRRQQLVLVERTAAPNELPIPEPRPATEAAQERLQKMKEHRDKRKGRQATREANEAPTAADLARQQREADAKMAALIREEEAAKKNKEAGKKDGEGEEEDHGGAGHIEGDNRNGADRGDGGGVSGVCRGLNVSAGGASWQQGSGQSQGPQSGGPPLPSGWKSSEKEVVVVRLPPGTSDASRRLSEAIISRTITDVQQMTQLIQQHGTDPNVEPQLRVAGSTGGYAAYPLLSLCIDNLTDNGVPSIWADVGDGQCPVAMPTWETPGLQLAVMRILIQRGADINRGAGVARPIRVAIASCNRAAFDLLMGQPGIQLRGRLVMQLPFTLPTDQPTEAHEAILLSFYRQLIQRDSTLATERDADDTNPLHGAAMTPPVRSQQFIEKYIGLLVTNGVDIAAVDIDGWTPLHLAAFHGSHCVAASLCRRRLTAADINRGLPNEPTQTSLTLAAVRLDGDTQQLQDNTTGQAVRDQASIRIPNLKTTIRVLLQAGADIALMPTATERDRRRHKLVLVERTALPNELPIPEPRPATIEAQERLQKLKEHRDKRKGRQATRQANEAPTAAELARQQREADAKMAALIREEAANKKEEAAKAKAGKKGKGKRGKGQHSATPAAGSPPGGEDDQADSTGAADDDQPASNDEDIDALLLGSAFAQRAVESHAQAINQHKAAPTKTQPAAHPKGSTHPPFSPSPPPTAKQQATLRPSADKSRSHQPHDRPLLSRPSGVSMAHQTPGEERLMGPSAGSKLDRGSGLGLSGAASSLSSRPAPPPPRLPSAVELCQSGKRRPFVSSSPSHPPPPSRPLPPAHRPASGADGSFPPPAHAPQQPDDLLPSSSSVDRPSRHRGPPPLVKCPKSSGASLSHDDARPSPLFELRSAADAFPSSSSYNGSSAAPPAPAAAAFAAPYQNPLGPLDDDEGGQGASAAAAGGVNDSVRVSSREAELQRQRDELARQLEETQRRLAELTTTSFQQHKPSSSGSSSAPPPLQQPPQQQQQHQQQQPLAAAQPEGDGRECAICLDAPPSVMYMPCRHLRLCRHCYDHRCSKWRRDLQQVRAENARRREENEGIKRLNEGRKKEKKIPLVELLDEPKYLCEQCKTKVVFAGSRDEVRQWADQPIT
ncbi:unnamed protein product [Vitrella brassicaformis CCMP3155]|uniref:RING-type domain-containing protein n=1 Tax=Vitrella brassicaformis (strain CCMP3155) TaxID=1169540 RepID=A0A0G4GCI6_VITBC|nr:unnamed protein product [Vitrella brassicaformis CCMP3155]|eukprot:CEM26986.1 unnamed protein product [Vitrella brassicaformis CCMP3155]